MRPASHQAASATGSWSASPTRNAGLVSSQGSSPVWSSRSRCSCATNAPDCQHGKRPGGRVRGPPRGRERDGGKRGEDDQQLRRVTEVGVERPRLSPVAR